MHDSCAEQGLPAWHAARLGKVTASRFKDVMTQPRSKAAREAGELSGTARSYMLELVAESLTGEAQGITKPTAAMQWGTDNEPAARSLYERRTGTAVRQVGFISHPLHESIGGSPDGLVGEFSGVEIKCPFNTAIHLGYILGRELPKDHVAQVQGLLWITGRDWWDFVSYDPRIRDLNLALWVHRVERDADYIDRLDKAVFAFLDTYLETLCTLKEREG